MTTLLFEVGTEEMPASVVEEGLAQIKGSVPHLMERERLEYGGFRTMGTPRRLTLVVQDLAARQAPRLNRKRGPSREVGIDGEGNWTDAARGFAGSQDIPVDDLMVEETDKGSYLVAVSEEPGKPVEDILPAMLVELIDGLRFPKSMRWGSGDYRFPRPIRWVLALLGEKTLELQVAGVSSGDVSYGHRYLSDGPVRVVSAGQYESILEDARVVVDQERRRRLIVEDIGRACEGQGFTPVLDQDVLREVVQLVEWPGVVLGRFPERYLELPREVLFHSIETHQRYFPVEVEGERSGAAFIAVHNGDKECEDIIKRGHERVLRARLEDAAFFYREDRKTSLWEMRDRLSRVVYKAELGSMREKTERIVSLVQWLGETTGFDEETVETASRAAQLAKSDLVSHMVTEFPDLQGVMGRIYAEEEGEDGVVARAIEEQYMPRFAGDELPSSAEGALLSAAEKLDNLASSFGLGHVPTGSEDPYGLRRQLVGLISVALENSIQLDLQSGVEAAAGSLEMQAHGFNWSEEASHQYENFVVARERVFFLEKGYRYDLVDAVLAGNWRQPEEAARRLEALSCARESGLLEKLYTGFERCYNLSRDHGSNEVEPSLLSEPTEREMFESMGKAAPAVEEGLRLGDIEAALSELSSLAELIDRLFDDVLIMCEDEEVRYNRLSLLKRATELYQRVADFTNMAWD